MSTTAPATLGPVPAPVPVAPGSELRETIALAIPVVTVQVGLMMMGVVDTLMVGRVSAEVLAAVALGNLYFFNVSIFGGGVLMALDPVVSQAVGAGEHRSVSLAVQRGLILGLGLAVFTAALMLPATTVLRALRQPPEIVGDAAAYLRISIPGVLPFFAFIVLRQTLQSMGRVAPIVWAIVAANTANVVLNWIFIYGNLGVPPLGARGSSIATSISRGLLAVLVLTIAWRDLRPLLRPWDRASTDAGPLRSLLRLGLPIGGQHTLEVAAFGAVGLLMGVIGAREMAAHQIAITMAALTFMVPLGVASAGSVRVGLAVGAGDPARARAAVRAAYLCGVGFMAVTAMVFLLLPRPLAELFTKDQQVLAVAALLVPIAGVFQIFDGAQAVGAGILRGLGDTRVPLIVMLCAYWLVGIPVSGWLGFGTELGAVGLWWGFVVSLAAVAVFLALRIRVLFGRELRRVRLAGWH